MNNNGNIFASQFGQLGLGVQFVKEEIGTQVATYYYNLDNCADYDKNFIKKCLEKMSAYNQMPLTFVPTFLSHFAISMPLAQRQTLWLTSLPQGYIGKEVNGLPFKFNFVNECVHLLVAGSTGTGKSVFLNSLIASLYLDNNMGDFMLYLIDPKRVSFQNFKDLVNVKLITDTNEAVYCFDQLIGIMEQRYSEMEQGKKDFMPIFVIVDELADLMLESKYTCEESLVRLAQKSRQANIHLILCTQRPTVNVVSGLIKAQCDTRVCFKMASVRDSITILDHKGGEELLGYGDCLIKTPKQPIERRVQIAYISDDNLRKLRQEVIAHTK